MIGLKQYIDIFEGGLGGHMAHPFDYTDFTANDLIDLVQSLFGGKIENLKEKLDGMNLNATMNNNGEVRFIRNDGDLNSPNGGMSIEDMLEKWAGKEHQKNVFVPSGKLIEKVFKRVDVRYFNPDATHRKVINCECIIAGNTNIIPYATDRVAFHGYKMYELTNGKYKLVEDVEGNVDELYDAAKDIDEAKPRPNLVIRSVEDGLKFAEKFSNEITNLWREDGLSNDATIEEWKHVRFKKFAPEWMRDDDDLYDRICNNDKSINLTQLKKRYPEHVDELSRIDKDIKKEVLDNIMDPIDNLFLSIGNELIDMLDGFINSGSKDELIKSLKNDLESTVEQVESSDSEEVKEKLNKSLKRLQALGNKFNVAEGIVVMYKGRRLKLTGSFAPLNQALGTRFDLEKINKN